MPKFNMYQALHTTVIGPEGRPLEIQIRTQRHARHGRVRHRRALDLQGRQLPRRQERSAPTAEDKVEWLQAPARLAAASSRTRRSSSRRLKVDLFEDEVFVFTPKGEVKSLAAGATPLDFAYAVHTDVGHRCVGAKVNGKIVPLHYELKSGDIVRGAHLEAGARARRATGSRSPRPPRAQSKIRAWFKRERREDSERAGRDILQESLKRQGLPPQQLAGSPLLADVIREMGFKKGDDFYIALGQSKISSKVVVNKIMQRLKQGEAAVEPAGPVDDLLAKREKPKPTGRLIQLRDQGGGHRRRAAAPGEVLPPRARATRSSATSRSVAASRSTTRTAPTPRR